MPKRITEGVLTKSNVLYKSRRARIIIVNEYITENAQRESSFKDEKQLKNRAFF